MNNKPEELIPSTAHARETDPKDRKVAEMVPTATDESEQTDISKQQLEGIPHSPARGLPETGAPIIGTQTRLMTLSGLIIGAAIGLIIGIAFGQGDLIIPGLAPLASPGASAGALVFSTFFGALLGLAGALIGTSQEFRKLSQEHRALERRQATDPPRSFLIHQMPIYGSIVLAAFMFYTFYVIAASALGIGEGSDQSNRVTWHQKNVSRVGGATPGETSAYVLQTAFPATRSENRPQLVVTVLEDWRAALAVTPLMARPINAAILISGDDGARKESARLRAASPGEPAAATLSIGTAEAESGDAVLNKDPAEIAAMIDQRRYTATGAFSPHVIMAAADGDYHFFLPAGAYAARTGVPILFVSRDAVPPATAKALQQRNGQARIYILGPASSVSDNVERTLSGYGSVTRIGSADPVENAVRFAEFRDDKADFGWGRTGDGPRQFANQNTILVNADRWQDAIMAAHLASRGKSGPLLFSRPDHVPAAVDHYLWRLRPIFAQTPAEGPFNHLWVVGSLQCISFPAQAWADYSQEIEQYLTYGDSALSGYEALALSWILLSIAGAIWIAFHSTRRMHDVMPIMKAAWTIFALLMGPIAVWLYIASYHRRAKTTHDGMTMWQRPLWLQTVSATVMMFAFDMMLMVLAVFLLAYTVGFPLIQIDGPLFWLGTSMFLMMVLMYLIAFILMMLVFHTPMTMHERKIDSYWKAFRVGFPIMFVTMTIESMGMMPTMWWQQMIYLFVGMQMPVEDELTMWSTLLVSVAVGFIVVYPYNYWSVRRGIKMGGM